jgi:hypothetical protein
MKSFGCGLLSAALMAFAAGCGGGSTDVPEVAPVGGTVTVKGQPRGDLNVIFHPEGGGRPAMGMTDADGRFTLTTYNTGDGAAVGTHHVAITAGGGSGDGQPAATGPPMPGFPGYDQWMKEQRKKIDPKYADPKKSGLTYTVPKEGLPDVEIKIP